MSSPTIQSRISLHAPKEAVEASPRTELAKPLLGTKAEHIARYSFLLTNTSQKPITAVATVWRLTDANGNIQELRFTTDSYLDTRLKPILESGKAIFIAPRVWVQSSSIAAYALSPEFASKEALLAQLAQQLDAAAAVDVTVDTVMFSDGTVIGPNKRQFDLELQQRKWAANEVVRLVDDSYAENRDPIASLKELASRPHARGDQSAFWMRRFALQLIHSRNLPQDLKYLENLPVPPHAPHGR